MVPLGEFGVDERGERGDLGVDERREANVRRLFALGELEPESGERLGVSGLHRGEALVDGRAECGCGWWRWLEFERGGERD